jgi:hypothetical protein
MKRYRKITLLLAAAATLLVATGIAAASMWDPYRDAIPATFRYAFNVDAAIADGYSFRLPDKSGATCIEQPGEGGMGIHMVNTSLLDGTIDSKRPEVLVYEPRAGGGLRLVAVEYVVFESAWKGSSRPALFGQEFDHADANNRYGLPPFYALHAWVWKQNPSGLLYAWNPSVNCRAA